METVKRTLVQNIVRLSAIVLLLQQVVVLRSAAPCSAASLVSFPRAGTHRQLQAAAKVAARPKVTTSVFKSKGTSASVNGGTYWSDTQPDDYSSFSFSAYDNVVRDGKTTSSQYGYFNVYKCTSGTCYSIYADLGSDYGRPLTYSVRPGTLDVTVSATFTATKYTWAPTEATANVQVAVSITLNCDESNADRYRGTCSYSSSYSQPFYRYRSVSTSSSTSCDIDRSQVVGDITVTDGGVTTGLFATADYLSAYTGKGQSSSVSQEKL